MLLNADQSSFPQVDQQLRVTQLNMKKANLTQEELKPVSDDTKLYEAIGRA